MKNIRVLIVDDHAVVRMGLAAIINVEKDLTVCGEAEGGAEAAAVAAAVRPDVVVMDLMMPDLDGADATAAVLKAAPHARVLILTTFGTSPDIARALAAGATGAVTKNLSNGDLAAAIRRTAVGERCLAPEIQQALDDRPTETAFTARQREVLESITRGLSNDDIARLLGLSKTRVKQHLNEIYAKLGAANRAEAVAIAMRNHLFRL